MLYLNEILLLLIIINEKYEYLIYFLFSFNGGFQGYF